MTHINELEAGSGSQQIGAQIGSELAGWAGPGWYRGSVMAN